MSNAVAAQLNRIKQQEIAQAEDTLAGAVVAELNYRPANSNTGKHFAQFATWCEQNKLRALPARDVTVAAYVLQLLHLGVTLDGIIAAMSEIQRAHDLAFGDPTSTPIVQAALDRVAGEHFEPPHSWPAHEKQQWRWLPLWVRAIVSKRELQRERAFHAERQKQKREREIETEDTKSAADNAGDAKPNGQVAAA
jgi:hypothetical protein